MARATTGVVALAVGLGAAGCGGGGSGVAVPAAWYEEPGAPGANGLTEQETAEGFRLLFDGRTTAGWRGRRGEATPPGWRVLGGALTRVGSGGDLVTVEQFDDFELAIDWRVAPGANSGIFFRVREGAESAYRSGPEFQVLDDAGHPDGAVPETSAGANYGLHAPSRAVARPAGEWNTARIVARGAHVEHWLNGVKIVEYELGDADWLARVRASKFAEWPDYGRSPRGHIVLQDHGDAVAFRNVKLRPLGAAAP
ncbi:MAG TPA: DUF1080 domain-containing protein [Polyangiaceae bacterium]|nr:DUF1080 domain-containing protein [Polyangiaceae bacterium]